MPVLGAPPTNIRSSRDLISIILLHCFQRTLGFRLSRSSSVVMARGFIISAGEPTDVDMPSAPILGSDTRLGQACPCRRSNVIVPIPRWIASRGIGPGAGLSPGQILQPVSVAVTRRDPRGTAARHRDDARVVIVRRGLMKRDLPIGHLPPMDSLSCGFVLPASEAKLSRSGFRCGAPGGSALVGQNLTQ